MNYPHGQMFFYCGFDESVKMRYDIAGGMDHGITLPHLQAPAFEAGKYMEM